MTACGDGDDDDRRDPVTPPPVVNALDPQAWEIGPRGIDNPKCPGGNCSVNMPPHPTAVAAGLAISMPFPNKDAGHVNYVTMPCGSLAGKQSITLKYRIEADPDVKFVPTNSPGSPSMLTLYFQRRGDNWSGDGKYETYRWWASFATVMPITSGDHVLSAPLTGNWTAIQTSSAQSKPQEFQAALINAERCGFVFGGGDGLGHGVYATGPARFIITGFAVE